MQVTNFYHTGSIGDCWASIPAMRTYYEKKGKKIRLNLVVNTPAFYYEGATHPTKGADGGMVMLNEKMVEMMKPLFMAQDFIDSVEVLQHDDVIADKELNNNGVHLEWIRNNDVGMPNNQISAWYFYVFPDLTFDLNKQWIFLPETDKDYAKDKIVITRSERYRNEMVDYSFLKPIEDDCVFIGTVREWNQFSMQFGLNVKYLKVNDFLQVAHAINQSKFHISNQTMSNQIGAGLMKPCVLELCSWAANCHPIGVNRYGFMNQAGLEYYVNLLNGTVDKYVEVQRKKYAASKETA